VEPFATLLMLLLLLHHRLPIGIDELQCGMLCFDDFSVLCDDLWWQQ
jgi:hypothetical protein